MLSLDETLLAPRETCFCQVGVSDGPESTSHGNGCRFSKVRPLTPRTSQQTIPQEVHERHLANLDQYSRAHNSIILEERDIVRRVCSCIMV